MSLTDRDCQFRKTGRVSADAEYKYKVWTSEFVWKPGHNFMEFVDIRVVMSLFRLQMLSSRSSQIGQIT
ncbi:MAG: hypothetical protein IPJ51_14670 [Saprospiraceae bacterium]|nr:hypothetical protein [Saprospiraceae bacterium]